MNASLPATARDQSALQAELTAALSQIVSDDALLWEREDTTPYECDGLAAYRQVPLAVVLPDTEAQVVEILRVCHRMGVPVVPRGAGTSLSGGAMPTPGGLVLSLAKFKRILKVDPYTRAAVVQHSDADASWPSRACHAEVRRRSGRAAAGAVLMERVDVPARASTGSG